MPRILPWFQGGLFLGAAFLLAVAFVKPIGVSTQFVIFDAIVWDMIDPTIVQEEPASKTGYSSSNAYLNKSGGKYAKNAAEPLSYGFVFVLAIAFGAFLSALLGGDRPDRDSRIIPNLWRNTIGANPALRLAAAFFGGILVLFGARLAGGCTSGHMMSGIMQTALSGYIFTMGLLAAAIITAFALYRNKGA